MDGIIVVDKPAGVTSREVDNLAKKVLDEPGVGHLGTLDPFATGVLVLGVGRGTKCFPFMEDLSKTYRATLALGAQTDTGEHTGAIIQTAPVPQLSLEQIKEVLESFLGETEQLPPSYSAKHVDGKRAYEIARSGGQVKLAPQTIRIDRIKLIDFNSEEKTLVFEADVSKGTYMRTLGEDVAKKLNTVGHLTALRRLRVGPFRADFGCAPEDLKTAKLLSMNEALSFLPAVELTPAQVKAVSYGSPLFLSDQTAERIRCVGTDGQLLAVYGRDRSGSYRCLRGFVSKK